MAGEFGKGAQAGGSDRNPSGLWETAGAGARALSGTMKSLAILEDYSALFVPTLAANDASRRAETTTPAGRLMLTALGGLAEFERELIKARTTEGRERAKRAGVKMGRKPLLTPHQIAEIRGRKAGGESVRFLARSYGVSPNTISRVR